MSAERIADLEKQLAAANDRADRADRALTKAIAKASDDSTKALVALNDSAAENAKLFGEIEKRAAIDAARDYVSAAGGSLALLRPILESRIRLDRETLKTHVVNADGKPHYSLRGDRATVEDLVEELRKDTRYRLAFDEASDPVLTQGEGAETLTSSVPGGNFTEYLRKLAGERTSTSQSVADIVQNPFRRSTWNMTDQCRLLRADPTRAAQLRAEAERGI